jgi:RNA polymerase sigma-70 factor (ECF subfamily)
MRSRRPRRHWPPAGPRCPGHATAASPTRKTQSRPSAACTASRCTGSCCGITFGDRWQAEDLLQETLLRAWRYLQDHTADVTKLRPWLYTIARRAAIDAARARQARPTEVILTDLATLPAVRDDIDQLMNKLTVQRGLMSLTPDHRQVLIEVFYHGRTARQAAHTLGIPEGTVKSRIYYGLSALAAAIGETRPATRHHPQTPPRRRPSKKNLRRPAAARPRLSSAKSTGPPAEDCCHGDGTTWLAS